MGTDRNDDRNVPFNSPSTSLYDTWASSSANWTGASARVQFDDTLEEAEEKVGQEYEHPLRMILERARQTDRRG